MQGLFLTRLLVYFNIIMLIKHLFQPELDGGEWSFPFIRSEYLPFVWRCRQPSKSWWRDNHDTRVAWTLTDWTTTHGRHGDLQIEPRHTGGMKIYRLNHDTRVAWRFTDWTTTHGWHGDLQIEPRHTGGMEIYRLNFCCGVRMLTQNLIWA